MKAPKLFALVAFVTLFGAAEAFGQQEKKYQENRYPPPNMPIFSGSGLGAGLGMALTIIGAGYGMGRIGSAALEGMARQPEVANDIRGAMIVIAALLEGAVFFGLLICMLTLFV